MDATRGWTLRAGASVVAVALLAACGGGSPRTTPPPTGGTPTPTPTATPTPTPTPSPTPTPTPTPTPVFLTAEYNRSDGPADHKAIAAWQRGATGQGVSIAIIDTGIDTDNPEFAGRILPASRDVAGSRGIEQEDDHGTNVALVAAAARDDSGVVGIAYEADLLVLRGDAPGTCADLSDDGSTNCRLRDTDIATGIDYATANGARIINLSLGGGTPSTSLRNAVQRAVAAGVMVVVSSGNDGAGSPDNFAQELANVGSGGVIIVGSVDEGGTISSFSNRAGTFTDTFLAARGERVCCVYENGAIKRETTSEGTFVFLFSGTSFAAPQVAGAAALLMQAFPNLTGPQVVALLLNSARDTGAIGPDDVYGRGILDIAAAFAPSGTTTLAGSRTAMSLVDSTVIGSPAMGDALAGTSLQATVLDEYERAYTTDIGARMSGARIERRLTAALDNTARSVTFGNDRLALSFAIDERRDPAPSSQMLRLSPQDAEQARVLAARVAAEIAPDTRFGVGYRQGAQGMVAQLQGKGAPAFMIADHPDRDTGFALGYAMAFALRRDFGGYGLTLSAESGSVSAGAPARFASDFAPDSHNGTATRFGLAVDRNTGSLTIGLAASWLREEDTVLGARFHDALAVNGANSVFLDGDLRYDFGEGWQVGGAWRQGRTFASAMALSTNGWALDLGKRDVVAAGDTLALRISQPLRVATGGMDLTLPIYWDYATRSATMAARTLSLAPEGREVDAEIAWRGTLWGGDASASLFYRVDPGHYAAMPDDRGIALRWSRRF